MLTRQEVIAAVGPVDDVVIAQIIGTGATPQELAEARAWMASDEALVNAGRRLPSGRVAEVLTVLERLETAPAPGAPADEPPGPLE